MTSARIKKITVKKARVQLSSYSEWPKYVSMSRKASRCVGPKAAIPQNGNGVSIGVSVHRLIPLLAHFASVHSEKL